LLEYCKLLPDLPLENKKQNERNCTDTGKLHC